MPAFYVGLAWFLGIATTKLVYRVLFAMGIGFTTYTGLSWALDAITAAVQSNMGGMTSVMLDTVSLLNLDKAFSVLLSAYAVVAFVSGSKLVLSKLAP